MKMRKILVLMLTALVAGTLATCSSGPKKGAMTTPIQFILKCEGGKAIREHRKRKEGTLVEKGPVALLPKTMTCAKAEDLEEKKLPAFKRHGEWTEFYSSGEKLSTVKYEQNKRVGTMEYFNKGGELTRTIEYKDGKKEGPELTLFAGTKDWKVKGQNSDNLRTGTWQSKSDREGSCISEGNYSKGYKDGPWTECGVDTQAAKSGGKLKITRSYYVNFKGSYSDGARSGAATMFFKDGAVQAKGSFYADRSCFEKEKGRSGREDKCSKRAGAWTVYHPNGKVAMTGSYDRATGLKVGTWTEYYQSGEKMGRGERKHTRIGRWTFWDKSGAVVAELDFKGSDVTINGGVLYRNGQKYAESLPGEGCRTVKNIQGRMVESCTQPAGGMLGGIASYDAKNDAFKFKMSMKTGRWAYYGPGGKAVGSCGSMGRREGVWVEGGSTKEYKMTDSVRCD